jgi:hypothetical protein
MNALLAIMAATIAPFTTGALSDGELASLRGGFSLPGGIDVRLVVQTDTSINGALVLRSVFRVADSASLQVLVPRDQAPVSVTRANAPGSQPSVWVSFDRSNGAVIGSVAPRPELSISLGSPDEHEPSADGLRIIDTAHGPVDTAVGRVTQAGTNVRLDQQDLSITHLTDGAFGSIVANSGNDRAIDTATTISLDLKGVDPANIGSMALRVEGVVVDAARMGVR